MKKSFILYTEVWPVVQKLDMEQRGRLFTAIMQHAMEEEPEKLDILTDVVFSFIANQMDRADERYQEICRRRAEYGRRGGLASAKAKASKSNQKQANQADNDNDNEPDNDNDPDNERENDSDNEAPVALPDLSLQERQLLDQEFGQGRVDELIDEVNLWAINHGQIIKNLPAMVRQFAKNQQRWGGRPARREKTIEEIAAEVFGDMEVTT